MFSGKPSDPCNAFVMLSGLSAVVLLLNGILQWDLFSNGTNSLLFEQQLDELVELMDI